mmetsp:Transcript_24246/g.34004  ORF Transcript_24246/g.34004 Transcript_24246/m.34004 type:complete len:210 (+) Transcript_24246:2272-2901(+)
MVRISRTLRTRVTLNAYQKKTRVIRVTLKKFRCKRRNRKSHQPSTLRNQQKKRNLQPNHQLQNKRSSPLLHRPLSSKERAKHLHQQKTRQNERRLQLLPRQLPSLSQLLKPQPKPKHPSLWICPIITTTTNLLQVHQNPTKLRKLTKQRRLINRTKEHPLAREGSQARRAALRMKNSNLFQKLQAWYLAHRSSEPRRLPLRLASYLNPR